MKIILTTLLLISSNLAFATIGKEVAEILKLEEAAKKAALIAKKQEIAAAFSPDTKWAYEKICIAATVKRINSYLRTIKFIKKEFPNSIIINLTEGEFAFFADCGNRNALENNMIVENIKFDSNGPSPLTIYLLDEMKELLNEKGPAGMTPLEFVEAMIKGAVEADALDLAGAYGDIRQEILFRLRSQNLKLPSSVSATKKKVEEKFNRIFYKKCLENCGDGDNCKKTCEQIHPNK